MQRELLNLSDRIKNGSDYTTVYTFFFFLFDCAFKLVKSG